MREEKGTAGKTTRCAHICHAKSKEAKLDAADDVTVTPGNEESSAKETSITNVQEIGELWRRSVVVAETMFVSATSRMHGSQNIPSQELQ